MNRLWACLYFPRLPVEISTPETNTQKENQTPDQKTLSSTPPIAVTQGQGAQRWIHCTNAIAAEMGIKTGMTLTAAYALQPDLQIIPRRQSLETEALARIAAWAYQFSGEVAIQEPDRVLLEVHASSRLYGGLNQLLLQLSKAVKLLSYTCQFGIAPTPNAASLLASLNLATPVTHLQPLPKCIANAPVEATPLDARTKQALASLGIYQIAGLCRLPRASIARRYGKETLAYLDRLTGTAPDPISLYQPPECFESCVELPHETDDLNTLRFILKRLLTELAGFLVAKDAGTQQFTLQLHHANHAHTDVRVGLLRPDRGFALFSRLLDERMERVKLPAPIRALSLVCETCVPYSPDKSDLFVKHNASTEKRHSFVDRLRARLGAAAVQALNVVQDHRPELAWRFDHCFNESALNTFNAKQNQSLHFEREQPRRPLWLLPEPQLMLTPPVQIITGPERIESGWWDYQDVNRDYYIAETESGQCCWVYRNLKGDRNWYLHGYFA